MKHKRRFPVLFLCLFCSVVMAQNKIPDKEYRLKLQEISDLTSREFRAKATAVQIIENRHKAFLIHKELAEKYRMPTTDMLSYFILTMAEEDVPAFNDAARLMILATADPIEEHLKISSLIYSFYSADSTVIHHPALQKAVADIRMKQNEWIQTARLTLDWKWAIILQSMNQSDYEYRSLDRDWFKDKETFWYGMNQVDSIHLEKFCATVRERGFPDMSKVGARAAQMQPVLHHCTGLLTWDDSVRRSYYVAQWKFLMPYLYKAVNDGEMSFQFYQHIYQQIVAFKTVQSDPALLKFFKQYAWKEDL